MNTPRFGWTIPDPAGGDDVGSWPGVTYQLGVDIENQLFLDTDLHDASVLPSGYPFGLSLMTLTADGAASFGQSSASTLLTIRRDGATSGNQILFVGAGNSAAVYSRYGSSTGWFPWHLVAGSAAPVAARSGTFTFSNVTAPRSITIAFPAGRFTVSPQMSVATHNAGVYANVNSVTPSGFTLVLSASDGGDVIPSGDYAVDWTAIQTDGSGS